MPKYDPLERYLLGLDRTVEHRISFAQVEEILGSPLPPSARTHQAWWANQRGAGHSQAHSWMGAGWHSCDLDLKAQQISFRPVDLPREPKLPGSSLPVTRPLTIAQAKAGLALGLGISAENIDIIIRERLRDGARDNYGARVRDNTPSFRIMTSKGGQRS